jgi:alpha-L-fucosidase
MTAKQISAKGLQWFLDSRFGMFIHWGLYSILARGEWVMHMESIPVAEYEKLAQQFNPLRFNADEWVKIAADAGQKYMVITSRHHDGFSMYKHGPERL